MFNRWVGKWPLKKHIKKPSGRNKGVRVATGLKNVSTSSDVSDVDGINVYPDMTLADSRPIVAMTRVRLVW